MYKRSIIVVLLTIGLCLSFVPTSNSATVINIVAQGALADIAGFEATIISPDSVSTDDFEPGSALVGFTDFSIAPDLLSFISFNISNSIDSGEIGSFQETTVLGEWELTNQAGRILEFGTEYIVELVGTDYNIFVPIPSAILLLGCGLISLFAIQRRQS